MDKYTVSIRIGKSGEDGTEFVKFFATAEEAEAYASKCKSNPQITSVRIDKEG